MELAGLAMTSVWFVWERLRIALAARAFTSYTLVTCVWMCAQLELSRRPSQA
jgi:hypothetical protein